MAAAGNFDVAPLLPADTAVLRALLLPPVYGITMAQELGGHAFLARAKAAFDSGLALVELDEEAWRLARAADVCGGARCARATAWGQVL